MLPLTERQIAMNKARNAKVNKNLASGKQKKVVKEPTHQQIVTCRVEAVHKETGRLFGLLV